MARNVPVTICITKHNPSIDPKYHHVLIFGGVGRSISELLITLISGCEVRVGLFIFGVYFVCRNGPFEKLVIFAITFSVNRR
jgi:hypothetical protein